jgi:hypothetical protein
MKKEVKPERKAGRAACEALRRSIATESRHIVSVLLLIFIFFTINSPASAGIVSMMISPTGGNSFGLMGVEMEGITSMQITISYDVSTMPDISVSPTGIIAMAKFRSNISFGTIQISVTDNTPVDGSGNIVIMEYTPVSENTPGRIISASVYVTDITGHGMSVPVVIVNPQPQEMITPAADHPQAKEAQSAPSVGRDLPVGGPVRERVAVVETSSATVLSRSVRTSGNVGDGKAPADSGQKASMPPNDEVREFFAYSSALSRIKEFHGVKSISNILPILKDDRDRPFRQEPFIAVSDGNSRVRIIMDLDIKGDKAPIFAVHGAYCLSLDLRGNSWILELAPVQGVLEATVTAMYDSRFVEFPLTLAPPLALYFKNRPDSAAWGYIDTYVVIVNQLAKNSLE